MLPGAIWAWSFGLQWFSALALQIPAVGNVNGKLKIRSQLTTSPCSSVPWKGSKSLFPNGWVASSRCALATAPTSSSGDPSKCRCFGLEAAILKTVLIVALWHRAKCWLL